MTGGFKASWTLPYPLPRARSRLLEHPEKIFRPSGRQGGRGLHLTGAVQDHGNVGMLVLDGLFSHTNIINLSLSFCDIGKINHVIDLGEKIKKQAGLFVAQLGAHQ